MWPSRSSIFLFWLKPYASVFRLIKETNVIANLISILSYLTLLGSMPTNYSLYMISIAWINSSD
jgi:hypothetical protein